MVPETPTLVYLHGIGGSDGLDRWLEPLNRELSAIGFEALRRDDVIDFDYSDMLTRAHAADPPKPRVSTVDDGPTNEVIAQHLERRNRLQVRLRDFEEGTTDRLSAVPPWMADFGARMKEEVDNYMSDSAVRALIWTHVLDLLPATGSVILVGHSLGSVIAVDVAARVPSRLQVRSLASAFHVVVRVLLALGCVSVFGFGRAASVRGVGVLGLVGMRRVGTGRGFKDLGWLILGLGSR